MNTAGAAMSETLESLVARLENAAGLDPIADRISAMLTPVLSRPGLRSFLSGTPVGHPLHPALVLVPIGTWTSAAMLDALPGGSRRAAQRLIGIGVLSALPASAAGATDWIYTDGAERRVGLVHAGINYLAVAMLARSWVLRRRGQHAAGVALSSAATALVAASGWLGGHLSYARGVGVDATAFQTPGADWADVIGEAQVAQGAPLLVHAGGTAIFLLRSGDTWTAMADRCTHRGAPLHEGEVSDGCVVCPWHGSVFELSSGDVKVGPASRPQPQYQVRIHNGMVQVRRGDEPSSLRTNPVA